jgi:hypothetical protein
MIPVDYPVGSDPPQELWRPENLAGQAMSQTRLSLEWRGVGGVLESAVCPRAAMTPTRAYYLLGISRMRRPLVVSGLLLCSCIQRSNSDKQRTKSNEFACIDRAARFAAPSDSPDRPGRHTIESRDPHFGESSGRCSLLITLLIKHRVHGMDAKGEFSNPYESLIDVDTGQTVARCGGGPLSCRIGRRYAVDCARCEALIDKAMKE